MAKNPSEVLPEGKMIEPLMNSLSLREVGFNIPCQPCVYFMVAAGEVIYIGSTISVLSRMSGHKHRAAADSLFVLELPAPLIRVVEVYLIRRVRPRLNEQLCRKERPEVADPSRLSDPRMHGGGAYVPVTIDLTQPGRIPIRCGIRDCDDSDPGGLAQQYLHPGDAERLAQLKPGGEVEVCGGLYVIHCWQHGQDVQIQGVHKYCGYQPYDVTLVREKIHA